MTYCSPSGAGYNIVKKPLVPGKPAFMRKLRNKITGNLIPVFRRRLSGVDALPQLAVLGLLSGLFTGGVILVFRLAIEWPLEYFLPGDGSESFEELDLALIHISEPTRLRRNSYDDSCLHN